MSLGSVLDAFQRWLPHPEYRFSGGPADGQSRVVKLHETERGMVPPDLWQVDDPELASLPLPERWDDPIPENVMITRHTYRFVPTGRSINQGYYEWVQP